MGGPPLYQDKYGTICLTEPHKPYQISADHRDQWLLCMDEALKRIDADEQVTAMLKQPMYSMADFIKIRIDVASCENYRLRSSNAKLTSSSPFFHKKLHRAEKLPEQEK